MKNLCIIKWGLLPPHKLWALFNGLEQVTVRDWTSVII